LQWGYRTASNGAVTPISGRTSSAYTIQGGDFPAGGGSFYLVVTVTSCGTGVVSNELPVVINATPAPTITASGPVTFCAGGSVTLTASAASTYAWSTGETTQSISVSASGSYSVTVTGGNGCNAASTATTVVVNTNPAMPVVSASGPTLFCAGGSVTLSAPAGYSYSWSNGATTQSISVAATGNYSVTVTDANGCSATSAPTTVTANPNPATPLITASGPTTFCAGGSVTLSAPAAYSYLWSNGMTTQVITVSATGDYSVSVTDASGCGATSAATAVTANSNPSPSITAPSAICSGGSGNASTGAITGASYAWTITNGTITSGDGTAAITFTSASGPVSLGVTVTSSGCSGSANATVNVNAVPNATITAGGATTFCQGGGVTLTASAASAASAYHWSDGETTQSITVSASGNYSVTITNAGGCSATSAATSVTVNAFPNATITAPSAICSGTTGAASVAPITGGSYSWSITGGTITGGSGTNAITFTSTSGTVSLGVTVTANGCSSSGGKSVAVNANPAKPSITAGGPTTFCAGGSVTLTATAAPGYQWSNGATTQSILVTSAGSYTVVVTNASGCPSPASNPVSVTVNPATTITQDPASITITHGTHTILSVTATGTGTLTCQWYNPPTPSNTDTSKKVGGNSSTYTTQNLATGTHYYYVTVTSSCGTVRSAVATVTAN
jgi:hypothetical protein